MGNENICIVRDSSPGINQFSLFTIVGPVEQLRYPRCAVEFYTIDGNVLVFEILGVSKNDVSLTRELLCKEVMITPSNAPMSGAGVRSTEASAPLAG